MHTGALPQLRPPALPAPGYAASLRTPAPDVVLGEFRRQRGEGGPNAPASAEADDPVTSDSGADSSLKFVSPTPSMVSQA